MMPPPMITTSADFGRLGSLLTGSTGGDIEASLLGCSARGRVRLQRIEPRTHDDERAEEHHRVRRIAEEEIAPEQAPGQRRVLARRRAIGLGEPVALAQAEEAEAAMQPQSAMSRRSTVPGN